MQAIEWFFWLMFDPIGLLVFGVSMVGLAMAGFILLEVLAGARR